MAGVIAVSLKIVGVLLITALLIIPAATARRLSSSPEQMAFFAILIGVISVWFGLFGSLELDTPAGPSIVVAALICFILSLMPVPLGLFRNNAQKQRGADNNAGVTTDDR
jgi:zinc transport system permease protein